MLHVNIKSLMKNMSKLEELILGMSISPDLIAISETWLTNSKTECKPAGLYFFSENSIKGKENNKYAV